MESNKGKNKAFLCYRGNTAFIAKSFLEYV